MKITFVETGWRDYLYWQTTDRQILKKVNRLIEDTTRGDPFEGIGKPEPLRHNLAGAWSRRLTDEHRLVYLVHDESLVIVAVRYHYER